MFYKIFNLKFFFLKKSWSLVVAPSQDSKLTRPRSHCSTDRNRRNVVSSLGGISSRTLSARNFSPQPYQIQENNYNSGRRSVTSRTTSQSTFRPVSSLSIGSTMNESETSKDLNNSF